MCIAIPPPGAADARTAPGPWARVRESPARLMALGAGMQVLLLGLVGLLDRGVGLPTHCDAAVVYGLLALYGPPAFLAFAATLTVLPRWLRGVAPDYLRYGGSFLLSTTGLGLAAAGLFLGPAALLAGIALTLLGLMVVLRSVDWWAAFAPPARRSLGRGARLSLWLAAAGLAAFAVTVHHPDLLALPMTLGSAGWVSLAATLVAGRSRPGT
jgi:hypothetical protein